MLGKKKRARAAKEVSSSSDGVSSSISDFVKLLPPGPAEHVFLSLPVPDRLRSREVCKTWRALLGRRLFRVLDLSAASTGICCSAEPGSPGHISTERHLLLIRAAVAASAGGAELLDISGCRFPLDNHTALQQFLLSTLRQLSRAPLRTLRMVDAVIDHPATFKDLDALLRAAPALQELEVSCVDLQSYNEVPLEGVRQLFRLPPAGGDGAGANWTAVRFDTVAIGARDPDDREEQVALVQAFVESVTAAAVAPPPGSPPRGRRLQRVQWIDTDIRSDAFCRLLADGVVAGCVASLALEASAFCPGFAPHLVRMLRSGALRRLRLMQLNEGVYGGEEAERSLFSASGAPLQDLCAALRGCRLERLWLPR